jgi:hypothetical protein
MRDPGEGLGRVEPPVQGVNLVAEPVEALEERVELAVVEGLPRFGHALILELASERRLAGRVGISAVSRRGRA